ncbi:MAG: hypothetical protein PHY47_20685 [Lachnospiraceae bacterium]|nr:hypothetical protein [Lachnospiraceae bacterium]
MRNEILDNVRDSDIKKFLMLLSCDFCDSCTERGTFILDNSLQSLFVLPIFTIARNMNEEHVLFRTMSITLLEKVQETFAGKVVADEREIVEFIDNYNGYHKDSSEMQQNMLIKSYQTINECSYLELFKRVLYDEQYSVAMNMAMNFFKFNVEVGGHGFYYNYSYNRGLKKSDKENIFFEIGRMLDEGATEWLTQKLCAKSDEPIKLARYHTEVSYIKKIIQKYTEKEVTKAYMSGLSGGLPLDFFYNITMPSEKCDFYHIFKFTDSQDWRSAISLLNSLPQPYETERK